MDSNQNTAVGLITDLERGAEKVEKLSKLRGYYGKLKMIACAGIFGAVAAVSWYFWGWLPVSQLCLLAVILYIATGRRWRWFYVAAKTSKRDGTALIRFIKLVIQNRSFRRHNKSVIDLFRENVEKHPDKTMFLFEDTQWTFQQVEDYSNQVAHVFQSHGYKKGDAVALFLENRPEFVCLWLGLAKLGVIVPLINYNLRDQSLLHSFNVAGTQAIIFGSELTEAIQAIASDLKTSVSLYRWTDVALSQTGNNFGKNLTQLIAEAPKTAPEISETLNYTDRLLYIYTSGTTGLPKAAVITCARFCFWSAGIYQLVGLGPCDIVYCPLPVYHSAGGVLGVGQAVVNGLTVVVVRKFSASRYFRDIRDGGATVCLPVFRNKLPEFMFLCTAINKLAGFNDQDRFYTPLPLYHTAGGCVVIGQALIYGCSVVMRRKFSASAYFVDCKQFECTVAQYIGEMCRYVLSTPPRPEDKEHKIRVVFGNGLRPQIWKEFIERFNIGQVAEFYGATEGNANIVNMDNTFGAIGFMSRIIPRFYPISIVKADTATGEPIRGPDGLCQICGPDEPGVFVGKIIENDPSREFLGYVDKTASEKKIVRDVFRKGDAAFLSGDIVVADELGYLYFRDRTGDTFRWKGENVSTTEVEAVVSNLINYRDCVVYGVEVVNQEGRVGMAAVLDDNNSLNLTTLAEGLSNKLPPYARPQLIRRLEKVDVTGTFKLRKVDLQKEGFDPKVIKDRLYYWVNGKFEDLTPEAYDNIQNGKIRF